jgi:hypothetical protein
MIDLKAAGDLEKLLCREEDSGNSAMHPGWSGLRESASQWSQCYLAIQLGHGETTPTWGKLWVEMRLTPSI